ncbi:MULTISPECIES: MFS transporter [Actinoalloteichus]|uniref:Arabinose efflux permease family protein n=1 Tax=Actinoalloteichus fjordicus TaxID=1612552 RepID=A0AAC9LES8_9PSEU|nr:MULTISPECIES: MFS transporter [Actinoalloteichus]APU15534.1 arabinose efflux permease family protein [Actinoalloteichus fjordicus]APU21601.1 arabinose efflux permease family protein [Actinoalloteichus sp. GBA129-24]
MTVPGDGPPPKAGRREWTALAVLMLPTMLTMLDIGVLFLALPELTAALSVSASEQLWITDAYGFLIAGFLVTMGTLGDRIGRRRLLLIGAAAFGVVSVIAAYSSSAEMLIASRALLGIAGATIVPSTLALVMGMFRDPAQRGVAISVWSAALTAGVALGPVLGGVLLHWFWWGSAFLVAVPVMVVLLVTGRRLLPEFANPGAGRLDPLSVVLSLAALLPFVYGVKEIARVGWQFLPLAAAAIGLLFGLAFVLRQRRLAEPLLDLRLFAIRAVSAALVIGLLVAAVQAGTGFLVAQHLQLVEGLSPLNAGLWVLVPTLALIIGIFLSQAVGHLVRPAYLIASGAVIAAVGMVVLTQVGPETGLAVLLIGFTGVYFGVSPVGPLVAQVVVPSAPPEKAGSASSLQSTGGELGVALGIALLGSVGAAVYRAGVDVPPELAGTEAGEASGETLAGALASAGELSPPIADGLVDSARQAFVAGLNTTATICAVAFLGLTVLALTTLRHLPSRAAASKR